MFESNFIENSANIVVSNILEILLLDSLAPKFTISNVVALWTLIVNRLIFACVRVSSKS